MSDAGRKMGATAAAGEPKGPKPYYQATPRKASAVAPQSVEPTSPRRLRLADLKRAFEARRLATTNLCTELPDAGATLASQQRNPHKR
jgi:hypothetical protein